MSKLTKKVISFPASDSPDVVGYKLYVAEAPVEVTYDSEAFDLGNNTSIDLASLEGMATKDGIFNIGVTAVDDAGNESSMSKANEIPLDFLAPNPPGEISFLAS